MARVFSAVSLLRIIAATSFTDDGLFLLHRFVAVSSSRKNRSSHAVVDLICHLIFIGSRHGWIVEYSSSLVCNNNPINSGLGHNGCAESAGEGDECGANHLDHGH